MNIICITVLLGWFKSVWKEFTVIGHIQFDWLFVSFHDQTYKQFLKAIKGVTWLGFLAPKKTNGDKKL